MAFVKNFSTGENHLNTEMKARITPSSYPHARLTCDDWLASDLQYIFQALAWIKRNAIASTGHFIKRKQFQIDVTLGYLQNQDNVMRMITDDHTLYLLKGYEERLLKCYTV